MMTIPCFKNCWIAAEPHRRIDSGDGSAQFHEAEDGTADETADLSTAFELMDYREGRTQLHYGDVLVIYSDGVSEACNPAGEEFGPTRLYEVVARNLDASAGGIRDRIESAEIYRLAEADLHFGELLPEKPGWLEQEEYEERTSVGFHLERLSKKVGAVLPRELAICRAPVECNDDSENRDINR